MPFNSERQRSAIQRALDLSVPRYLRISEQQMASYKQERIANASACVASSVCDIRGWNSFGQIHENSPPIKPIDCKAQCKAENKAKLLMQNIIGAEQSDIYRGCHRIIVNPSKWFWIIGDITGGFYNEKTPFRGKPQVFRIDNVDKMHWTSFCVQTAMGSPETPFTDKVIAFVTHLVSDERKFKKMINRIEEGTFDKMPVCAAWRI